MRIPGQVLRVLVDHRHHAIFEGHLDRRGAHLVDLHPRRSVRADHREAAGVEAHPELLDLLRGVRADVRTHVDALWLGDRPGNHGISSYDPGVGRAQESADGSYVAMYRIANTIHRDSSLPISRSRSLVPRPRREIVRRPTGGRGRRTIVGASAHRVRSARYGVTCPVRAPRRRRGPRRWRRVRRRRRRRRRPGWAANFSHLA